MEQPTDKELRDRIADDPFHKGLDKHGTHTGPIPLSEHEIHVAQRRICRDDKIPAMTDEEVEESRSKLSRLRIKGSLGSVGLVLTYLGILGLMAKAYA